MVWTVTFLTFPIRLLSAIDRERKMDRLLGEMQSQMDRLVWENKELEERLKTALKEHKAMEEILDEMEEEHEDAFARIDLLESQLKALKQESMRLNEHKGKSTWDKAAAAAHGSDHGKNASSKSDDKRPPSPWEPTGKDQEEEAAAAQEEEVFGFADPCLTAEEAVVRQGKAVARRRSLFSLGMSLAVGAIVWSSDAPCLPLLTGLFAVVGMSMCSVARFFRSALRSRPASDAVALLSLNWFLLGVLTSPMLPGLARAVLPRAARLVGPALAWFAAAAPL